MPRVILEASMLGGIPMGRPLKTSWAKLIVENLFFHRFVGRFLVLHK